MAKQPGNHTFVHKQKIQKERDNNENMKLFKTK